MSNLWFNVRFGNMHWQLGPDGWDWFKNPYHDNWKDNPHSDGKWFRVYCAFGKQI